jgi:putative ABC transport system ATP-binding protein
LILDEPFSHLDNENSSICFEIIRERCKNINAGIILTSLDEKEMVGFDKQLKL